MPNTIGDGPIEAGCYSQMGILFTIFLVTVLCPLSEIRVVRGSGEVAFMRRLKIQLMFPGRHRAYVVI